MIKQGKERTWQDNRTHRPGQQKRTARRHRAGQQQNSNKRQQENSNTWIATKL